MNRRGEGDRIRRLSAAEAEGDRRSEWTRSSGLSRTEGARERIVIATGGGTFGVVRASVESSLTLRDLLAWRVQSSTNRAAWGVGLAVVGDWTRVVVGITSRGRGGVTRPWKVPQVLVVLVDDDESEWECLDVSCPCSSWLDGLRMSRICGDGVRGRLRREPLRDTKAGGGVEACRRCCIW